MSRRNLAEILLHPVRLRIVLSLAGQRKTPGDIQRSLDDVAHATLYRHINRLVESGVIDVVEETPVRGGVERTLALAEGAGSFAPDDIAGASPGELLDYFVRVMAGLIGDFARYLGSPDADPAADRVGFRQVPIWLDDAEFEEFAEAMNRLIRIAHENDPEGRRRRLLTTVVLPVE